MSNSCTSPAFPRHSCGARQPEVREVRSFSDLRASMLAVDRTDGVCFWFTRECRQKKGGGGGGFFYKYFQLTENPVNISSICVFLLCHHMFAEASKRRLNKLLLYHKTWKW